MKTKIFLLIFLVVSALSQICHAQTIDITSLGELSAKPASSDVFVIVDVSDTTQSGAGSTKKVTYGNLLKAVPYDLNWGIYSPTASMINLYTARLNRAVTLSSMGCIVDPANSGESVIVNVYECDSNGDNCTTIINQITCANTPTAATITDSSLAANAFLKITIGTVTGTVTSLLIYGTGTQDW